MSTKLQASADGTYGSLSVGANEAFRFGADRSGQLAGFRNKLINGGFQINQRGTINLTASIQYFADRWMTSWGGGTTPSLTAGILSNGGYTSGSCAYVYGTFNNNNIYLVQRIEAKNSVGLMGKSVTVRGMFYQDTGSAVTVTPEVYYANTTDDFSATTLIAVGTGISLPSGIGTPVNFTFTAPSDVIKGLAIHFRVGILSGTAKNLYFGDMQLEEGSIATPFEQRPIGLELMLCQRYYQKCTAVMGGYTTAGTGNTTRYKFNVPMRTTPTVVVSGQGNTNTTGATVTVSDSEHYNFNSVGVAAGGYASNATGAFSAEL